MGTIQNGPTYILEVISEPPLSVKPGEVLDPPLVVGLQVAKEVGSQSGRLAEIQ